MSSWYDDMHNQPSQNGQTTKRTIMTENGLCNICIEIMQWWANNTGLGYGAINVILFIVIAPIMILTANILAITATNTNDQKLKKFIYYFSWASIVLFIIGTVILVGLPALDIMMDLHHDS